MNKIAKSLTEIVKESWSNAGLHASKACVYGIGFVEGFCLFSMRLYARATVNRIVFHELNNPRSEFWRWYPPCDTELKGMVAGKRAARLGNLVQCGLLAYAAYAYHPAIAAVPVVTNVASVLFEIVAPGGWADRGVLHIEPLTPVNLGMGKYVYKSNPLMDDP